MTERPQADALAKALKGLTIAVWSLCALNLAQLALYAPLYLRSSNLFRDSVSTRVGRAVPRTPRPIPGEPYRAGSSFHELQPEKMVKRSSAMLLTQWRKVDGEVKEIVTEILKHDPGSTLYYSVGDEFQSPGGRPEGIAGDGNVIFMEDSPASMRFSCSYSDGRVHSFGEMPLAKLRELARNAK